MTFLMTSPFLWLFAMSVFCPLFPQSISWNEKSRGIPLDMYPMFQIYLFECFAPSPPTLHELIFGWKGFTQTVLRWFSSSPTHMSALTVVLHAVWDEKCFNFHVKSKDADCEHSNESTLCNQNTSYEPLLILFAGAYVTFKASALFWISPSSSLGVSSTGEQMGQSCDFGGISLLTVGCGYMWQRWLMIYLAWAQHSECAMCALRPDTHWGPAWCFARATAWCWWVSHFMAHGCLK